MEWPNSAIERHYAPIEIAHLLGVGHKTVLAWLRDPEHPLQGNKLGTMWRISESALRTYLEGTRQ
jgi:excisionase family DNA binding protein